MDDGEVILTADDIVRAGACREGVAKVLRRLTQFAGTIAAAMPVSAILRLLAEHERGYVTRAAQLDGHGDGNGYYGYGHGCGSDYYGYGYGDGDGDAYGYGDGDCYGGGYGDGDGYGGGYGDGDGYGGGDCYGGGDDDGHGYGYYGHGNGHGNGYAYAEIPHSMANGLPAPVRRIVT